MRESKDFWQAIATWASIPRCYERRRTHACHCVVKRGRFKGSNPCQRADDILEDLSALSVGLDAPNGWTPAAIADWMEGHCCNSYRSSHCNHKVCNAATELIAWLRHAHVKVA